MRAFATVPAVFVASLNRCPLCRSAPCGPDECCRNCSEVPLDPGVSDGYLWLGAYRGHIRRAVLALKYGHTRRLARHLGAAIAGAATGSGWRPDVVCAVPSRGRTGTGRDYNQSRELARSVASTLHLPHRSLLGRRRGSSSQVGLSRSDRMSNVANAFTCTPLASAVVLLVDDVLTTGATAGGCRQALLGAGAHEVLVAVVARA